MQKSVPDSSLIANFVVLFMVKLDGAYEVDGAVFVYFRNKVPYYGEVVWEEAPAVQLHDANK